MFKGKHVVIVVLILLLIMGSVQYLYTKKEKEAFKEDVMLHLREEGYLKSDIQRSYIVNTGNYSKYYTMAVSFKDETGVEYFYTYEDGGIKQVEISDQNETGTKKHEE